MRFKEFRILREAEDIGYFTVGDSHAKGLADYNGKPWNNKAKNGTSSTDAMHISAINSIPKGSVVVISVGANDTFSSRANPEAIASNVSRVVSTAVDKGLKVHYLLFPVGTTPNASVRKKTRELIKKTLSVPIVDLEGSRLVDGVHADRAGYVNAAKQVMGSSKLSPQSGTPATTSDQGTNKENKEALTQIEIPSGRVGKEIADIQKVLVALGYTLPKYGIDGIRGVETSGAIKSFQADNKLKVDGDPGPETVGKLNDILKSKPELSKKLTKSTASEVKSRAPDRSVGNYSGDAGDGVGETGSAREAMSFFISKGWSPAQAAGVVGNLQAESGANMKTDAIGDGGKAYGIAQWHPDRQANFKREYGKDIRQAGFKEQLEFVQWELENTERSAASKLRQTKTPEQAAWVFDEYYERSSGAHRQKRINNALALMPKTTSIA